MSWYKIIRPIIFRSDPEEAHLRLAKRLMALPEDTVSKGIAAALFKTPEKPVKVAGLNLRTPLGIAAGFDKNAEFYKGLETLGIGFVELGSVTLHPQKGNPRPRIVRLVEDRAIINRMGLNNVGLEQFIKNLQRHPTRLVMGASIAPNHDLTTAQMIKDMTYCAHRLDEHVDYLSLNLSCPNQDGVTSLQEPETILELLKQLKVSKPVFCKFSSDLKQKELFACLDAIRGKVAGVIMANTSLSREGLRSPNKNFKGGLSGKPLFNRVLALTILIKERYQSDFSIIFSGGIFSAEEALLAREAGADLIQIYSGMIYEGPGIFKRIGKRL